MGKTKGRTVPPQPPQQPKYTMYTNNGGIYTAHGAFGVRTYDVRDGCDHQALVDDWNDEYGAGLRDELIRRIKRQDFPESDCPTCSDKGVTLSPASDDADDEEIVVIDSDDHEFYYAWTGKYWTLNGEGS